MISTLSETSFSPFDPSNESHSPIYWCIRCGCLSFSGEIFTPGDNQSEQRLVGDDNDPNQDNKALTAIVRSMPKFTGERAFGRYSYGGMVWSVVVNYLEDKNRAFIFFNKPVIQSKLSKNWAKPDPMIVKTNLIKFTN